MCDNKGPTLTVIQSSQGYLFGGYTPLAWDSKSYNKHSTEGFIFTLTNPHKIPPTKYTRNQQDSRAIYCNSSFGPVFGNLHPDIAVSNNCHQNDNSYSNFPSAYNDTTRKGVTTFTGKSNFTVNEIEVFSVI